MNSLRKMRMAVAWAVVTARRSEKARGGLVNAVFGVFDYLAQPLGMLLAAPFLIHRLGLSQYGMWMLASATVGAAGLLSTGFGDATIRYASLFRGQGDWFRVNQVVGGTILINLVLSTTVALTLWTFSPYAVHHWFKIEPELQNTCVKALQVGSVLLVVRSIDSVFVSVLRAFEQYRPAVEIAVCMRAATVIAAVGLVAKGQGVVSIMVATLAIATVGMILQALAVRARVGPVSLLPVWHKDALAGLLSFGSFSWLQGLSGIVFNQADRLIIGTLLGTSAVAYYSVCTQAAQPIHGLIASGLHFLFPHLSARDSSAERTALQPLISTAFWLNAALVLSLSFPVILLSKPLLALWMGPAFAHHTWIILTLLAISFGLLGLNVTGHYTLLALGEAQYVTCLNLLAGAITLIAIGALIPRFGLVGAAAGRLFYGPITWVMYLKIRRLMPDHELHGASAALALSAD
jgi:O-antigen/teichoic acid export membrane protein